MILKVSRHTPCPTWKTSVNLPEVWSRGRLRVRDIGYIYPPSGAQSTKWCSQVEYTDPGVILENENIIDLQYA